MPTKLINVGHRYSITGTDGETLHKSRAHWVNPDYITSVEQVAEYECSVNMTPGSTPMYVRTTIGINELLSLLQ